MSFEAPKPSTEASMRGMTLVVLPGHFEDDDEGGDGSLDDACEVAGHAEHGDQAEGS